MIQKVLYGLLTQDAQLTALVQGRVTQWPLPQTMAYPCISYVMDEKPVNRCDNGIRIIEADVMVGIFANTMLEAETIGEHVVRILDRQTAPVAGVNLQSILLVNGSDDYDEEMRMQYLKQNYVVKILT